MTRWMVRVGKALGLVLAVAAVALLTQVWAQQQALELVGVRPFIRLQGTEASGLTFEIREVAGRLQIAGGPVDVPGTMFAPSLTPAATAAAIGTTEQSFTVTGLATSDRVYVNGPAPTSLCPMVHARVSAANTLTLAFSTLTAAACTPVAGTYNVVALRS